MKVVEATGKTVEEAIQNALAEIDLPIDRVKVEILAEPSPGLFGLIGSRLAKVRLQETITPEQYMKDFLEGIINRMGLTAEVDVNYDGEYLKMNVTGNRMGMLIGKRGQTLNALQYLLNVVYHKQFPEQEGRLLLDVENYRGKREEALQNLALNLAKKALRTQREVVLEPMTPHERRIIHTALQDHAEVTTYSQAEDPYRKVVIAPK